MVRTLRQRILVRKLTLQFSFRAKRRDLINRKPWIGREALPGMSKLTDCPYILIGDETSKLFLRKIILEYFNSWAGVPASSSTSSPPTPRPAAD